MLMVRTYGRKGTERMEEEEMKRVMMMERIGGVELENMRKMEKREENSGTYHQGKVLMNVKC